MKQYLIIILLILISCERPVTNKELYFKASGFENLNSYKEANLIHDRILKKNPNFRPSLINRGANKSSTGDFNGAISDYKKVIGFDYDNTLALANIANNFKNLNLNDSAVYYYSKAIKATDKQERIYTVYNGDFDKDFQYYVEIDELIFERALTYLEMKKTSKAILDFKEIIDVKNRTLDGTSYYYIGRSYEYLKDTINACLNFKKALKTGILSGVEQDELVRVNKFCSE